jgi:hypothetical protein
MKRIFLFTMLFGFVACTPTEKSNCNDSVCAFSSGYEQVAEPVVGNKIRGTVTEPYVQPMRDVVKVPAQVDPMGIYYRPSHETIVEIIPGRVQHVEYPEK